MIVESALRAHMLCLVTHAEGVSSSDTIMNVILVRADLRK